MSNRDTTPIRFLMIEDDEDHAKLVI